MEPRSLRHSRLWNEELTWTDSGRSSSPAWHAGGSALREAEPRRRNRARAIARIMVCSIDWFVWKTSLLVDPAAFLMADTLAGGGLPTADQMRSLPPCLRAAWHARRMRRHPGAVHRQHRLRRLPDGGRPGPDALRLGRRGRPVRRLRHDHLVSGLSAALAPLDEAAMGDRPGDGRQSGQGGGDPRLRLGPGRRSPSFPPPS